MIPMTSRERVLKAVSRQKPDRVPKDVSWGFTPPVLETFRQKTGSSDPEEYFGVDVRFVGLDLPPERVEAAVRERRQIFGRYYDPDLPLNTDISEWGTAYVPGTYYHFTHLIPPMRPSPVWLSLRPSRCQLLKRIGGEHMPASGFWPSTNAAWRFAPPWR